RIPELKKKLLLTVGLLFVYRIGFHVPIPGVDFSVIAEMLKKQFSSSLGGVLGLIDVFSAGNFQSGAIFSLGILPYISASIIFSLLVKVVPSLEKLAKEGAAGQKKINQYTRYLTPLLCVIQAFFVTKGTYSKFIAEGYNIVDPETFNSIWWQLMAVL